jgi:predicted amidohydrolase YtcJ
VTTVSPTAPTTRCCGAGPEMAARVRLRPASSRSPAVVPVAPRVDGRADLLVAGAVTTMDPARPRAEAFAVAGGRIVALGSRSEMAEWRGPGTELVDLGEDTVLPGFVDPHLHLVPTALFDGAVDCSPFTNRDVVAVVDRLHVAASAVPPGQWVLGRSFDPSLFPGHPVLTRELLDRVAPDRPVAVLNASMHFLYVNSAALALAGVDETTPDPPGGIFYRQDGRLTGVVGERGAMGSFLPYLPVLSQEEMDEAVIGVMARAAAQGITRVHDAATGQVLGRGELDLLHRLAASGRAPVRVTAALADDVAGQWEDVRPGDGDDWVRAVSWKIVSDGSNQGYTGFQREPYLGSDEFGQPNLDQPSLAGIIDRAHRRGWQVMVHANGDAAIDLTLDAFGQAVGDAGPHDRRHRIEHCSLAHADQLARMQSLGLSPSFLMNHVYYWGREFRDSILGPERADLLDPVASALAHGLRPSFHSDHSVSPIGALRHVQTAVTRRLHDGGDVLNPAERVDVDSALRAVTVDAAWQVHADGALRVGAAADFVVLADDPREVDVDGIADIQVLDTWVDGQRRFSGR